MRLAPVQALAALALATTLLSPSLAAGQDYDSAGRHFNAGQKAFARKSYVRAAREFETAYKITKDPLLLYNIGEAKEKAGDTARALQLYRQYLAEMPKANDRAAVEQRIAALEAKAKGRGASPLPSPPAVAQAPAPAPAPPVAGD